MVTIINQTELVPVYVDFILARAPRRSSTDLSILMRMIHNELSLGPKRVEILFRRDKRKRRVVRIEPIRASISAEGLEGVVAYLKGLHRRSYALFDMRFGVTRKHGTLMVIVPKELFFARAEEIVVLVGDSAARLSDILEGYRAVVFVSENRIDYLPSKNLVESVPNSYAMNLGPAIAYRPFRYTI